MVAVYNTFGQVMWTMLVFFAWILFFWLLFAVFGDLFRRSDISGWGKAAWSIFVIFLPFLGCFVYLIARGTGMTSRSLEAQREMREQQDEYVRSVVGSSGGRSSTEEIASAKQLLDDGAISQAEFDQLKARALATA